jgi:glutamate dehydrogenase (NADP+)/cyclic pyranopterin phosphate synthase/molybdopterin-guanine dinucleotide biosynthesis protein A
MIISGGDRREQDNLVTAMITGFRQCTSRVLVVVKDESRSSVRQKAEPLSLADGADLLFLDEGCYHTCTMVDISPDLQDILSPYIPNYDAIIVVVHDEHSSNPLRLIDPGEGGVDGAITSVCLVESGCDDENVISWARDRLEWKIKGMPPWACVLIGGKSSRMGRSKHLLVGNDGRTWLETMVAKLEAVTTGVVLSGKGVVPDSLVHLPRLEDIVGVQGPLAGILAAMRWNPSVSWLLVACDMPDMDLAGLKWLLSTRGLGVWGTVPRHPQTGQLEPLLAHYDFRSSGIFEKMLASGCLRMKMIGADRRINTPKIPVEFCHCWRNCNTPEDFAGG